MKYDIEILKRLIRLINRLSGGTKIVLEEEFDTYTITDGMKIRFICKGSYRSESDYIKAILLLADEFYKVYYSCKAKCLIDRRLPFEENIKHLLSMVE